MASLSPLSSTQKVLITPGFRPRTGEEHRRLCYQYAALKTPKEKELFFSKYGVRWTEFARLEYFDLIRYTVVDPMHNLFPGEYLSKTLEVE
jgi:hypothetical protein